MGTDHDMNPERKNILIVEDEREYAEMVRLRLELAGFNCAIAETTQAGISEMTVGNYDLMILDLMLPGGGGCVLLNELSRDSRKAEVPVVVLTGKPLTPEVNADLKKHSISAVFAKPYDPEKFLGVVQSLVKNQTKEWNADLQ
jgi:two-component system, OmpR family, phosphate regulon response regulator PhoB